MKCKKGLLHEVKYIQDIVKNDLKQLYFVLFFLMRQPLFICRKYNRSGSGFRLADIIAAVL